MTVRDLRASDAPWLLEFLKKYFPEEEAILGTRPEGFTEVVRKVFRWQARLVLGFLRLVGRPVYRFFVVQADGRTVATTLLTFSGASGYVSMVVVDPSYRHRGYARALLEKARHATRARGRRYIVLDVLTANRPARALYDSLGYRTLRETAIFVHERPSEAAPAREPPPGLRSFHPRDAPALAEVARRGRPPEVERVLPTAAREIAGSPTVDRVLTSESAAWVIEDASGPTAWVSASISPATEAAHLSNPIVDASVPPDAAEALVRTAVAWCATRRAPRVMAMAPAENERGRAALAAAGFREAIPSLTLYRTVD